MNYFIYIILSIVFILDYFLTKSYERKIKELTKENKELSLKYEELLKEV